MAVGSAAVRLFPQRVLDASGSFVVVWANRRLRLVAAARLASVTGRWATTVALAVVAFTQGGVTAVGLLGIVRILPAALAGPIAAGLLGRVRSDRLLLVAGVARTVAIGAAGVALLGGVGLAPVFALVGLESLLSTMVRPLQTAALPFLAQSPGELTAANLALTTIENSGMLFGPLLAGLLLTISSPGVVLLATAGAYALSTVLIARIPAWERVEARARAGDALAYMVAGVRVIQADPQLRLVVGLYCAENLVAGALNVLIVVSALQLLNLGNSGVGVLNGAVGIGGVVGAIVAAALLGRRRIASDLGLGLVLCGAPIILVAAIPGTAATLVLLAVLGTGVTIVDFAAVTLLQRAIPDEVLARVFSVLQSVFVGTIGMGALLAPLLVSWLGIRGALLTSGAVLPLLTALLWRRLVRLDAAYLATNDAVELLAAIPIFAPLDLATLERLARALEPQQVGAGEVVIRQGDPGDLYYIIRTGEMEVSVDDRPVRTLSAGEGFGEIALLRGVPRTSTVVATTNALLYALDRSQFLNAVAGNASSRNAADALIDTRLGGFRAGLASL
jgi:Cyclic nucleotide-binding domain/Transmembrane secretion effector